MVSTRQGFTLIELILTMTLIAILTGVALPRLTSSNYESVFFVNELTNSLRYAKKIAIATQVNVVIVYDDIKKEFTFRQTEGAEPTFLMSPNDKSGETPYIVKVPKSFSVDDPPTDLQFTPAGQCTLTTDGSTADWTMTVDGRAIKIVGETGFIYEA